MSPMASPSMPMPMSSSAMPMPMPSGSSMDMGGMDMSSGSMDMMMGPDLFPMWIMIVWIVALAAVLVFHCGHLVHMGGQHRWFHLSHVVMLIGMLYMYASMAFKWDWVPNGVWIAIYVVTTVAIIAWMVTRFVKKEPFSYLWILALVQQAAMIYMWLPMKYWVAWLSYGLAAYFLLETIAWLVGLCDDGKAGRGNAVGPGDRAKVIPLGHSTAWGRISMAIMAASMGYMFVGMQIM